MKPFFVHHLPSLLPSSAACVSEHYVAVRNVGSGENEWRREAIHSHLYTRHVRGLEEDLDRH